MKFLIVIGFFVASATALSVPRPRLQPGGEVTVLRSEQGIQDDGSFSYTLELSDGTKQESRGFIKNPQEPDQEKRIQVVEGSYTAYDPTTGTGPYTVTYIADENGFQPSGAHLPTAPPTPDHVVKLLQIINANVRRQREIATQNKQ